MNISNLVKRMDLRRANTTLAAMPWIPRAILPHPEPRALSPARPAPFLRASRFALLALALCGALLLMATPASAQQTVVTLVSNTGQTTLEPHRRQYPSEAQGFVSRWTRSFPSFSRGIHHRLQRLRLYARFDRHHDFDTIAEPIPPRPLVE